MAASAALIRRAAARPADPSLVTAYSRLPLSPPPATGTGAGDWLGAACAAPVPASGPAPVPASCAAPVPASGPAPA